MFFLAQKKVVVLICGIVLAIVGSWYVMPSTSSEDVSFEQLRMLSDHTVPVVQPTEVIDLADGDTLELTASIVQQTVGNRTIKRLAYNQQIPGPVLRVAQGATVTVNLTNEIDMETLLHSHGLRGDWKFDGTLMGQQPIGVGETFSYTLTFPDAGVYWYHPHIREDYQQDMGLYGNYIVAAEQYWGPAHSEAYLIVDDMLEAGDYDREHVTHTLMGRFGDQLLINDQTDYNLTVPAGTINRLFLTNVASARVFDLHFAGATMKLVGGDTGRIEQEIEATDIVIAPSERYIVEVYYDTPGVYPITHREETIGTVTVTDSDEYQLGAFATLRSNPSDYTVIRDQLDALVKQVPHKELRLNLELSVAASASLTTELEALRASSEEPVHMLMGFPMTETQAREHCQIMPQMSECDALFGITPDTVGDVNDHHAGGIEWEDDMEEWNQETTDSSLTWFIEDKDTGLRNLDINWSFTAGDLVKVRIHNESDSIHPMHHPIHFHGQRFVVLTRDGVVNDNLQWKDTVLIPMGQTVDLLVDMSNPGQWMAHCHIAEHMHAGMMFHFHVE